MGPQPPPLDAKRLGENVKILGIAGEAAKAEEGGAGRSGIAIVAPIERQIVLAAKEAVAKPAVDGRLAHVLGRAPSRQVLLQRLNDLVCAQPVAIDLEILENSL